MTDLVIRTFEDPLPEELIEFIKPELDPGERLRWALGRRHLASLNPRQEFLGGDCGLGGGNPDPGRGLLLVANRFNIAMIDIPVVGDPADGRGDSQAWPGFLIILGWLA